MSSVSALWSGGGEQRKSFLGRRSHLRGLGRRMDGLIGQVDEERGLVG